MYALWSAASLPPRQAYGATGSEADSVIPVTKIATFPDIVRPDERHRSLRGQRLVV
jgi:hypothetical protein